MAKTAEKVALEIRKNLENKKMIIGTERTIKKLKLGKVSKVYITKNCPGEKKKKIEYYCKLGNVETINLKYTNEGLGVICKKPYSISVASLLRE